MPRLCPQHDLVRYITQLHQRALQDCPRWTPSHDGPLTTHQRSSTGPLSTFSSHPVAKHRSSDIFDSSFCRDTPFVTTKCFTWCPQAAQYWMPDHVLLNNTTVVPIIHSTTEANAPQASMPTAARCRFKGGTAGVALGHLGCWHLDLPTTQLALCSLQKNQPQGYQPYCTLQAGPPTCPRTRAELASTLIRAATAS